MAKMYMSQHSENNKTDRQQIGSYCSAGNGKGKKGNGEQLSIVKGLVGSMLPAYRRAANTQAFWPGNECGVLNMRLKILADKLCA